MKQVIAITEASSPLGELVSRDLAKAGHIVYACMSAASVSRDSRSRAIRRFAVRNDVELRAITIDGSSEDSVQSAMQRIVMECGRLDVLIHIAGPDVFCASGACAPEQLAQQYDTHILNTQRLNRVALPAFRDQGHGLVMWIAGSHKQERMHHYLGPYLAAKAALDALAASDTLELARCNVEWTVVLPGSLDSAKAIVTVVEMTAGTRPLLVYIDMEQTGQEIAMKDTGGNHSREFRNMRLSELLHLPDPHVIDVYS